MDETNGFKIEAVYFANGTAMPGASQSTVYKTENMRYNTGIYQFGYI
nr:hypothetical protein [uncultured Acetatifactor sp.]